jgi:hypothetical protein
MSAAAAAVINKPEELISCANLPSKSHHATAERPVVRGRFAAIKS